MLTGCVPWPDDLTAKYRREGYWQGESLADLLRPWAASDPGRPALVSPDGHWTYGALDGRADRLAAGLAGLGIGRGDRVVVQLPNGADFVAVSVALFRLGALPVFALAAHRRSEIAYLCEYAEAVAVVVPDAASGFDHEGMARDVAATLPGLVHIIVAGEPSDLPSLAEVEARGGPSPSSALEPGEAAFFLLSGGTTGMPKLIPRTHDDYAYQLRATAEAMGVGSDAVYVAALPLAHNAALGCPGVLGTLRAGGRALLAPSPSPDDVFPLVQAQGATLTTLMPPLLALWLETAELFDVDLSGVVIQVGGARLPAQVAAQVRPVLGARLTHWFGMAEGFLSFTRLDDPEDVVLHTQGRPLCPSDELLVVDEQDEEVAPGAVGELIVRGPTTLRGYYQATEYNAKTFTEDGYLRTGDLVRITPSGNMVVEGRVKDVVNRGGEKISAGEVEEHLLSHPAVRAVAVVPVPDASLGEKSCAVIVVGGAPPTLEEVRAYLAGRGLAEFKLPDRLAVLDVLPQTNVGKVDKRALAAMLTVEAATAYAAATITVEGSRAAAAANDA